MWGFPCVVRPVPHGSITCPLQFGGVQVPDSRDVILVGFYRTGKTVETFGNTRFEVLCCVRLWSEVGSPK